VIVDLNCLLITYYFFLKALRYSLALFLASSIVLYFLGLPHLTPSLRSYLRFTAFMPEPSVLLIYLLTSSIYVCFAKPASLVVYLSSLIGSILIG
jgi:hypothetical protein